MPLASTFGAASARAFGFGAGSTTGFVTSSLTGLSSAAGVISLSGASVGQLAVIHTNNLLDGTFPTPAGWSADNTSIAGYDTQLFTKVLSASDIATGSVTVSGARGGYHPFSFAALYVARATTSATIKSVANNTSSATLTIPGFTRDANAKGVLTFAFSGNANVPTAPTGFTSRLTGTVASASRVAAADLLRPNQYANGSSVTWTGFSSTGSGVNYGYLIELK